MYKYYNALQNRAGDVLVNFRAKLFDQSGNQATLYCDAAGTAIVAESMIADTAVSDNNGMVRFYVNSGIYDLRLYDPNDVYYSVEKAIPMIDAREVAEEAAAAVLAGKSDTGHRHDISDIEELGEVLDGLGAGINAQGEALAEGLTGKSDNNHGHEIAGVAGLSDALDAKLDVTGALSVVETKTANYTMAAGDVRKYIRIGASSALTITVQTQATQALPVNGEWHFRAIGDVSFSAASGVTINAPFGGTPAMKAGMAVTLKRVAENVFDLLGQTVAA